MSIPSFDSDELVRIIGEEIRKEIDNQILEDIRVAGLSDEEKEAEEIIRRLKAPPKPPRVIMPVIRRVMPNISANEIVGVQPMTSTSPEIFAVRYKFKDIDLKDKE